ncbi:MAG: 5-oxoprolinase subunit B family protein [Solirubrobacteraceae bacterium]
MRVLPYGDHALLVELPDLDAVLGLYAALRDDPPPGVVDLVPAARTLLVVLGSSAADPHRVAAAVRAARPAPVAGPGESRVDVPVVYDGEDLEEVAALTGLSSDEVVERHCAPEYVVGFSGFLPGFGYLLGLDPRLRLPRLPTPRVRVPAGSVAVAGDYTGVYPRSSPGGWRLLGRTDLVLFDAEREPPALLAPTTRVRFRAVAE